LIGSIPKNSMISNVQASSGLLEVSKKILGWHSFVHISFLSGKRSEESFLKDNVLLIETGLSTRRDYSAAGSGLTWWPRFSLIDDLRLPGFLITRQGPGRRDGPMRYRRYRGAGLRVAEGGRGDGRNICSSG
jgi:hypothetical protein